MPDRTPPTDGPELYPPIATVPPLDCPPGTVPGWLDENGYPTSCVGDDPMIEPTPEIGVPVDIYPTPDELANTGADWPQVLVVGLVLALAGFAMWIGRRK